MIITHKQLSLQIYLINETLEFKNYLNESIKSKKIKIYLSFD